MILDSLSMQNFRPFAGQQNFPLSPSKDGEGVTILFGTNGSGKTTLLNAFTWCLYGNMSQDTENPDWLLSNYVWEQAELGDDIPVTVELEFRHGERRYRARRTQTLKKKATKPKKSIAELELWEVQGGQSKKVEGPQQKIESILPERLSRFFFFNGERIERLVKLESYAEVKQDIKSLLGLEHIERALDHLPRAGKKFGAELKKYGSAQAGKLQTEIEKKSEELRLARENFDALKEQNAEFNKELESTVELLRKHSAARPLQKSRDDAEANLKAAQQQRDQRVDQRNHLVATRGYMAFLDSLSSEAGELARGLRERGSLPAPLKRDFVDSLLEDEQCICGTELVPENNARKKVEEWRSRAGLAEVETAWQQLNGEVQHFREYRANLRSDLMSLTQGIDGDNKTIADFEGQLSDLNAKVKDLPVEEVSRLEKKRVELLSKVEDINQKIGTATQNVAELQKEVAAMQSQLKDAKVGDVVAQKARRRLEMITAVESALRAILEIRSAAMRQKLEEKVQTIFSQISMKAHYPRLNDDFELGYYQKSDAGEEFPAEKSTGENQILSLSFVAAVSKLAREVADELDHEIDSGDYPIVLDAAFGSLDDEYQREVSRAIAALFPQMIVLVSKQQGEGAVFKELRPHASNIGVIVTHTTKRGKKPLDIEIDGYSHPYRVVGADADRAELLRITP